MEVRILLVQKLQLGLVETKNRMFGVFGILIGQIILLKKIENSGLEDLSSLMDKNYRKMIELCKEIIRVNS